MLGNFCFEGDYWKKEAIGYAVKFFTEELGIPKSDFKITVFEGDNEVPFDEETYQIWQDLGFSEDQITKRGREDNFWGPTGDEGPCGPTTEIYLDGSEVWNIVFNEYFCDKNGKLTPLKNKGVDTGMGLERLARVLEKKETVFETDLFSPLIEALRSHGYELSLNNIRDERIVADHIRGAIFLIDEGLLPSNVKEGYVLRKVLRRAIRSAMKLNLKDNWHQDLFNLVAQNYSDFYPSFKKNKDNIIAVFEKENNTFKKALNQGIKELEKMLKNQENVKFSGELAFKLYESYGFPLELTEELLKERGYELDKEGFEKARKTHQDLSKKTFEKKVGGLSMNPTDMEIKLHTATHLLHKALRDVLGNEVKQMGSDINDERLRFDFSFGRAMTAEEKEKVEKNVNEKIKEDLIVERLEMSYDDAIKMGALGFFKEKYPKTVSVYKIHPKGNESDFYSCEICKGPHVKSTLELGQFKILKEEAVGAGVRRIKASIQK